MAWNSSLLGSNQVSSYQHIDNLRNDLVAGKFWDKSDGTETKYTSITHNSTEGVLDTSAGSLLLKYAGTTRLSLTSAGTTCTGSFSVLAGQSLIAYQADNSSYIQMYVSTASGRAVINSTSFPIQLSGGNGGNIVYIGQSILGQSKIYMYDATLAAWKYIAVDNGAVVVG